MKINLVENGVFPITKDADGNLLEGALDTGLSSPTHAKNLFTRSSVVLYPFCLGLAGL